ncbi:MAG: ROK family protein [Acidobacteriota bacterium]|nr:ROK family protein [Acidobacteriota bacterium]
MAKPKSAASVTTLCLDIGGTGIKGLTADPLGQPTHERVRLPTPRPATPDAVLAVIHEIAGQMPPFSRVAAGFPGVVIDGTVHTAPNLGAEWAGFPLSAALEKLTGRPARVANDAGVQGLAVIEGRGTELVLTLGTGMGFALYIDGHYVPNIEMAHHLFRGRKTYEERIGNHALEKVGRRRWNKRVLAAIKHLEPVFNYRVLYLGGGNAKLIHFSLPPNVRVIENMAGLLGGVRLWVPHEPGDIPATEHRPGRPA